MTENEPTQQEITEALAIIERASVDQLRRAARSVVLAREIDDTKAAGLYRELSGTTMRPAMTLDL